MDKINLNDPNIKKLVESDSLKKTYPLDRLPKKLIEPTTDKGKSCLFEEIDTSIYEAEARMIAFRTTIERVRPWIKALNIFYFEFYGNHSDKRIVWADNPTTLSQGESLKSITIDIQSADKKLLYKISFFLKTGLIQCQGNNIRTFVTNDFPQILNMVQKFTGTSLNTKTQKEVTKQGSDHEVEEQNETHVKQIVESQTDNITQQTTEKLTLATDRDVSPNDENNNVADNLLRLQGGLTDTVTKLESSNSSNTDKILQAISNCEKSIQNIPSIIKSLKLSAVETTSSADMITLRNKLKLLEDENNSLKSRLQIEKGNTMLLEEKINSAIKHEQGMLEDTRKQMKIMVNTSTEELEYKSKIIDQKNQEISELTSSLSDTKLKLDEKQDEILQLKSQMSASFDRDRDQQEEQNRHVRSNDPKPKPKALLIGTSNIQGIDEHRMTQIVEVTKVIKYTLEDTNSYISSTTECPDVLVLHSLTNDLKSKQPNQCVDKLFHIITAAAAKWPNIKCVISFTTPRKDQMRYSTSAQIINVLIKEKFCGVDNIYFAEHTNMLINGNPNEKLLNQDKVHLNDKGISILASNIKRAVFTALHIPLPPPRNRSRSTQRQMGRGRGREQHNY